ncbi:hypothetical protein LZ30DRAFT_378331 [Colletotrichum cereale]|nr:hypothetical protein LZ30DRAFT_378331 [Colletotrichum cereale]
MCAVRAPSSANRHILASVARQRGMFLSIVSGHRNGYGSVAGCYRSYGDLSSDLPLQQNLASTVPTYLTQKAPGPRPPTPGLRPPVFIEILTGLPVHPVLLLLLLLLFHGFGGPSKSPGGGVGCQCWLLGVPEGRYDMIHYSTRRYAAADGDIRLIPSLGLAWPPA